MTRGNHSWDPGCYCESVCVQCGLKLSHMGGFYNPHYWVAGEWVKKRPPCDHGRCAEGEGEPR